MRYLRIPLTSFNIPHILLHPLISPYNPLHLLQAHRAQLAHELAEEGFDVLVTSYSYFEGDSAAQVADPC